MASPAEHYTEAEKLAKVANSLAQIEGPAAREMGLKAATLATLAQAHATLAGVDIDKLFPLRTVTNPEAF